MSTEEWTAVAAVAGLALSIFNLLFLVVRWWWKQRSAEPSASWEIFDYRDRDGLKTEHRLVIVNQGPATMKDLEVKPRNADRSVCEGILHPGQPQPVPVVFPNQAIYVVLAIDYDHELTSVVLRWRDRRLAQQEREIWLTHHHVR